MRVLSDRKILFRIVPNHNNFQFLYTYNEMSSGFGARGGTGRCYQYFEARELSILNLFIIE